MKMLMFSTPNGVVGFEPTLAALVESLSSLHKEELLAV